MRSFRFGRGREQNGIRVDVKPLRKRVAENWQMYLLLALPLIYLIIFCYWPMLGAQIAFRKYKIRLGIWGSPWVGLDQFTKFFRSYYFERVFGNTLRLSFYSILVGFPLPILFALQMNAMRSARARKFAQTITYMPHFISVVTLAGMIMQIFNVRFGIFAQMYHAIYGPKVEVPNILLSAGAFPHLYVLSGVWQNLGWDTVIYTAALASVDPALHEAATIDGASRVKRILHVDLPAIIPTISIMLILRFGQIMNIGFDKPRSQRAAEILFRAHGREAEGGRINEKNPGRRRRLRNDWSAPGGRRGHAGGHGAGGNRGSRADPLHSRAGGKRHDRREQRGV